MDPPNVFWFLGAFAIEVGVYALIETIPASQQGLWRLVVSVAFFVAFVLAAFRLLTRRWWIPGGLAAALAVGTFPAVAVGFLQLIHAWPDEPFFRPFDDFSGHSFGVALATFAVGVVTFALTRFPFVLGVAIGFLVVASQLFVPCYEEEPGGDDRAVMALAIGAALVLVGIVLDVSGRRREAFWFHVFGLLAAAGGLVWFTADPDGDPSRGWIPMLIVSVLLLISAEPVRRATWAVYGVLGFYAALVHYLMRGLNEDRWPFALLLLVLGLTIFAAGMVTHRYGRTWRGRLVRRPPPTLSP